MAILPQPLQSGIYCLGAQLFLSLAFFLFLFFVFDGDTLSHVTLNWIFHSTRALNVTVCNAGLELTAVARASPGATAQVEHGQL